MLSANLRQTSSNFPEFDYYVDSDNGSDNNNGVTPQTAFATLNALTGKVQSGDRIGLAKGSHFYEKLKAYASNITVSSYGTGARPIIDSSRIIPAESWNMDPENANVYYADVIHEVVTVPDVTDPNHSNTFHICVWENETVLTGKFDGADIAANRAVVAATPGTFTAHLQGSTDPDPRSGTGGTQYRYYVHLSDSGNPGSNGAVMAYAEQDAAGLLASGGVYRGLEFRRAANKDMVGMASGLVFCNEVSDCMFRDPGCHAAVIRPALLKNNYAYGRSDGRSKLVGGYGFDFYYGQSENNYTPAIVAQENFADGLSHGIGSHGTGNSFPVHEAVTLRNNTTNNCNTAISVAATLDAVMLVDGHTALHCKTAIAVANSGTTVRGMTYLSAATGTFAAIALRANALIEDSSFVFVTSDTGVFAQNDEAQQTDNPALFYELTLNRVSNKGGVRPLTARWAQVDLRGEDTILGKLSDVPNTLSYNSIEMTNSYLSERQRTIAEMQAAGATFTDCVSPWQQESQQVTVSASEVSIDAVGRTVTSSGAGLTSLTVQLGDTLVVNAICVPNWDGAGNDWYTYLLSNVSTTYTIPANHATPGAFTSKAEYYARYNKQFEFGRPLRQYHSAAPNNGPSYSVVDGPDVLISGYQTSLLYYLNMQSPRKVGTTGVNVSASNSQVDAVNGIIDAGFDVVPGATLTVTAVCDHSAEDLVWQGDPDTTGIAVLDSSSPLYALGMGRQA